MFIVPSRGGNIQSVSVLVKLYMLVMLHVSVFSKYSCTTEALEIKGTARSVCALRQLISMHDMVYGVLTQPYTLYCGV